MFSSSGHNAHQQLYRLILDHALDAFIAIDEQSRIVEWNRQAEQTFGWSRQEVLGLALTDTIIPERYQAAHRAGMTRFLATGESKFLGRRVEVRGRRKDGSELPIELAITPIDNKGRRIFSAALRDLSQQKGLEKAVREQASLTKSILDSMASAVIVAEKSGRIILTNPAAQQLLNVGPVESAPPHYFQQFPLFHDDAKTPYAESTRPMNMALRNEPVTGAVAFVQHEHLPDGIWVSIDARPLIDDDGVLAGGVVVLHDITELRRHEAALAQQTQLLREQADLLDLSQDAILVRNADDTISYWNRSAERLYGIGREQAIGRNSHELLQTQFPIPLDEIKTIVHQTHTWEGRVRQRAQDGRDIIVFSQWALDDEQGRTVRYLETNTDITRQVQAEQTLRESQENYRLLVETSVDYGIVMVDPAGTIASWNPGAEKILGLLPGEAIGQPVSIIFTPEDRKMGHPLLELEKAKTLGRAEDIRWHMRKDGTRVWINGITMALRNDDGSLRGFVKMMRDQTSQRLEEEQTQFLASHDALTGIANRVHFSNQLHKSIAISERTTIPLAVLLLDLDRFKYVNDTFGHHVGDLLLKEVASRIISLLRETDFVARLGGDEFVVIQSDVSQPAAAETLAQRLIAELGRPYYLDGSEVISGTSVGISTYPVDAKNPVELLKRSDLALYRAKSAGRGTYYFYTSALAAEQSWKKNREQALRHALEKHEFELYYQPQIDLDSWKISTVEALLRWQATELELVLPNDFLDIAEETGLIVEIGEWALRQACRQVKAWQSQGMTDLRISVNCSARQFGDPAFVKMILPILEETDLAATCLELEVSETMLARHPEVKEQLSELRAMGVRITIDNYGTGTTALIDLKEFEVDALKIDKAFVQHLPHRRKDSAIASAIISLAHDLGIGVSAGGVETAEQLAYLKARDCTSAQGFIFSPPVPAEKLEELIKSGHWSRVNRLPGLDDTVALKDLH